MSGLKIVLTKYGNYIAEIGIRSLLLIVAIVCVLSSTILHSITPIPIVHMGNAIIYGLFVTALVVDRDKFGDIGLRAFDFLMILFLLVGTIGRFFCGGKLVQYLWSLRNYLRFYMLFIDCYLIMQK